MKRSVFLEIVLAVAGLNWGHISASPESDYSRGSINNDSCQQIQVSETEGVITSSPSYPQPETTTGCKQWQLVGPIDSYITISFDDVDFPRSDPRESLECDMGYISFADVQLCGSFRHISAANRTYIFSSFSLVLTYRHVAGTCGRGFRMSYLISPMDNPNRCESQHYQCANKKCIPRKWRCNRLFECLEPMDTSDVSDETLCQRGEYQNWSPLDTGSYLCPAEYFGCNDSYDGDYRCFPNKRLCDGFRQCSDGRDEAHCTNTSQCQMNLEGPAGFIMSSKSEGHYLASHSCQWDIHVNQEKTIQLRFSGVSLPSSHDYLELRDQSFKGTLLANYTTYRPPPRIFESSSNRLTVILHLDAASTAIHIPAGFNATFQEKGYCLEGQSRCGFSDDDCYDDERHCDGTWDCPLSGGDERGCFGCDPTMFSCESKHPRVCFKMNQRCDGITQCDNKNDERQCTPQLCGHHNGTFLCHNSVCIYESWVCDGTNDCMDNSDEINCHLSRKVVIAAVIGSLICGLLLTLALGCTCQLHALRAQEQRRRGRYRSPLSRLQDVLFAGRLAPPNYNEAMVTSRPYDDARRDFLEAIESGDNVDIPAILTTVTTPNRATRSETENVTPPRQQPTVTNTGQRSGTPSIIDSDEEEEEEDEQLIDLENVVVPPPRPGDNHHDDAMIDVGHVATTVADNSNVMVNITVDAGISAQWRRQRPKDHCRTVPADVSSDIDTPEHHSPSETCTTVGSESTAKESRMNLPSATTATDHPSQSGALPNSTLLEEDCNVCSELDDIFVTRETSLLVEASPNLLKTLASNPVCATDDESASTSQTYPQTTPTVERRTDQENPVDDHVSLNSADDIPLLSAGFHH